MEAPPRTEEWLADQLCRAVVGSEPPSTGREGRDGRTECDGVEKARLEQKEVHVPVFGNCLCQFEEAATRQQGESEQDEPIGEIEDQVAAPHSLDEFSESFPGARLPH